MAETKTNIPVEIKMGNAGTNDANLPAFKEGSIIFTKDTKKIYIDPVGETERIAVGGGSSITVDSKLSGTSTNPVQNKVINTALDAKQDTITNTTDLTVKSIVALEMTCENEATDQYDVINYSYFYNYLNAHMQERIWSDVQLPSTSEGTVLLGLTIGNKITFQNDSYTEDIIISGIKAPTADNDAVNRGYLTTKYGSTYYESQGKEFYLPSGSNMVIPNTGMGRLFMGSEGANSTDFKIYVNDPMDGGKLLITNLKTPSNDEDAANKAYVDTQVANKQAKFAEYTSTRPSGASETINYRTLTLEDSTIFTIQNNNANASMKFYNSDSQSRIEFNSANFVVGSSSFGAVGISSVKDSTTNKVKQSIVGGENSAVYVSATGRTAQSGTTIETATEEGADAIAFNVNEKNIKLLTWSKGAITNYNAPLLGVATPVATADTSKGITTDDLDYQAANKKYVDTQVSGLIPSIFEFQGTPTTNPDIRFNHDTSESIPGGFRLIGASGTGISFDGYYANNMLGYRISSYGPNPLLLSSDIKKAPEATIADDNDITTKKYVDDALTEKQDSLKLKNSSTDNSLVTINPASTSAQIFDIGMTNSVISMDGVGKSISLTAGSTNLFIDEASGISVNSKKIIGVIEPTEDTGVANKKYVDDIKAELLNAITHPYTYDETTKELTLIL